MGPGRACRTASWSQISQYLAAGITLTFSVMPASFIWSRIASASRLMPGAVGVADVDA